jgi:hypothetical protein
MIILMIAGNTSINEPSSPLTSLFAETSLLDSFQQVTSTPCTILAYARGSKHIDYLFTSQSLIPFINKVSYLAFYGSRKVINRVHFSILTIAYLTKSCSTPCTILTYARGSKRIGYMFISQSLIPFINKISYLVFYESRKVITGVHFSIWTIAYLTKS